MIILKNLFLNSMKIFYSCFFFLLVSFTLPAQNFNGQWKGGFNEASYGISGMEGNHIDYVLELETDGSKVSGYSYTYFTEGPKRYYTICRLVGTLDRDTKDVVVTEVERTKFNTPPDFQNCFQTHRLHYEQDSGDIETLRGTWVPAPNQNGNCGYGTTFLSRRIIKRLPLGITHAEKNIPKTNPPKKETVLKPKNNSPRINKTTAPKPVVTVKPPIVKKAPAIKDTLAKAPEIKKPETVTKPLMKFEPRRKDILKTIPIYNETFRVDFYDNGEIDGDSISVFYNGKIVLSHKMLSTKPIPLTLALDEDVTNNIITMYADNLGSIPPNTALMIVTDGDKRYEVRIESDTEKSGSVIFVHGEKEKP
jgi:hypothetical protein